MSGIVSALRFDSVMPFEQLILLTKDEKSDFGFAFGELISFFVKRNVPMIFINISQSFNHYCHLAVKFGVSLKSLKETGQIVNIDFLKLTERQFNSDSGGDEVTSDCSNLFSVLPTSCELNSLRPFYVCVKDAVDRLFLQHGEQSEGFVLFIDELNILLNLGVSVSALELFVHYCYSLCYTNPKFRGCFIIGAQDNPEDEECHQLLTYFAHSAHVRLNVQGLSTGYSNDVHGKILIENKSKSSDRILKMLFKVEDKGAKTFPLGI